jgi:hypothetical protein
VQAGIRFNVIDCAGTTVEVVPIDTIAGLRHMRPPLVTSDQAAVAEVLDWKLSIMSHPVAALAAYRWTVADVPVIGADWVFLVRLPAQLFPAYLTVMVEVTLVISVSLATS